MIDRLEMFTALARERHFGRAAAACRVTQPTLSSAIRALETQLGVQLVVRGARFEALTPEGERVLLWARRILADTRAMTDEARAARAGLSGVLRIGVIPTALPLVARLTAPYAARHPGVGIIILSHTSAAILQELAEGVLDAGITYLGNEPLGRVASLPLFAERYRLLLPEGHPLAQRKAVGWADLAGLPLCLLTGEMQNRRIIDQHLSGAGRTPGGAVIESNSTVALVAHVLAGPWVSIVPEALANMVAGAGGLGSVAITGPDVAHQVGLVTLPRDPAMPVVQALVDLAARLAPLPGQGP